MKHLLKIKPRTKKPKPVAIHNYKASYLDKRSKTYHRIVMTAFSGLFGLAGLVYVFNTSAATDASGVSTNSNDLITVLVVLVAIFLIVTAVYFAFRKK
jgi:hypothetical protein